MTQVDPRLGLRVVHKRYVAAVQAHYAGNLVDGAFALGLFGDVATEICIRTDGDEGLFASYSDVQFLNEIRGGDVVEATGTVVRVGRRSREIDFVAWWCAAGGPIWSPRRPRSSSSRWWRSGPEGRSWSPEPGGETRISPV